MVGCFGFNGPSETVIQSISGCLPERGRKKKEMKGGRKMCRLVGCFGLNGPLRQYFSLYRVVSQREGERKEK